MSRNKQEEPIIRYDSPEAAKRVTLEGWLGGGMFYPDSRGPNAEDMARYAGCTHKLCECGALVKKGWVYCDMCSARRRQERYNAMPFEEWGGITPLYSNRYDKYFFSDNDIIDFIDDSSETDDPDDHNIEYGDLDLIICTPNYLRQLDFDGDEFPEDQEMEDVVSKEVIQKLNELNELIKAHPPISWSPGRYRTSYNPTPNAPTS